MGGIDEEMEEEGEGEEEEETCGFGKIGSSEDENRVVEWEIGLPSADDLMPLSQLLVPPELASAFSISPEPFQTTLDVSRAAHKTLASLRNNRNGLNSIPPFDAAAVVADAGSAAELKRAQRFESEEGDSASASASASAAGADCDDQSAPALKRPRLVWTPQLHKRFVDVVAHLGIKNAVPKTIMNLMNVEGLTRENVASHLQKYRLYLKRMQGLSTDDLSSSDQLFASTPVPQSLQDAGKPGGSSSNGGLMPILMPYPAPHMMPMPVLGMPNGHGHMPAYHGFESHPYGMFREQQRREWSGKNFGAMMAYPHMAPSDK